MKNILENKENLLITLGTLLILLSSFAISVFNPFSTQLTKIDNIKLARKIHPKNESAISGSKIYRQKNITLKNGNVLVFENKNKNSKRNVIKIYTPIKFKQGAAQETSRNVPCQLTNPKQLSNGKVVFECTKFIGYGIYNPKNNTFKVVKNHKTPAVVIKKEKTAENNLAVLNN